MIERFGSTLQEKPNYVTTFLNLFIIIRENDSLEHSLDARHLNLNVYQPSESLPLEHLETQPARVKKIQNVEYFY